MTAPMSPFTCALCQAHQAELVVRETDGRTIVRCLNCGMRHVHPFPSDEALAAIYQTEAYFGMNSPDPSVGYSAYAVGQIVSTTDRERLRLLARWHPPPGRLLDVGCAFGSFLLAAHEAGWQPLGLEISEPAARTAREKFGLEVFNGTLQNFALPEESVDAVTLWEVIEHVREPIEELRRAARLLRPGGVMALSTPNAASLRARQEGPDWYGYHVSREHLLFFSPETLSRALQSAGFRVVHTRTRTVDPSLRRLLLGRRGAAPRASAECHPGLQQPGRALRSPLVQALIAIRETALRPLEVFGLGHNLEMYALKSS